LKKEKGFKQVRYLAVKKTAVAVFFVLLCGAAVALDFREIKEFEPKYYSETGIIKDGCLLARWERKTLFHKDIFVKDGEWKRARRFNPRGFFITFHRPEETVKADKFSVMSPFMAEGGLYGAFTLSLGSVNSSIAVVDMKKNRVIYSAELVQSLKAGIPGISMERVMFGASVTPDGAYAVCDSFDREGKRMVYYIDTMAKKEFRIENAALGRAGGGHVYYIKYETGKEGSAAARQPLDGSGTEEELFQIDGGAIGIEYEAGAAYVITDRGVYAHRPDKKGANEKIYDFSKLSVGYEVFNVEMAFSGNREGISYLLIVVKRYDKGMYSWMIYGAPLQ